MLNPRNQSNAAYRSQLADIIRRARLLEDQARQSHVRLDSVDPEYASWLRIERRYATVRGNAEHLLLIHEWARRRRRPIIRLLHQLHLI